MLRRYTGISMSKAIRLSREQVFDLCPDCAKEMKAQGIKTLKLEVIDPTDITTAQFKFYDSHDRVTEFKFGPKDGGFHKGLCKRFGDSEGFFTRCEPTMAKHVSDPKGFCAALKHWCYGVWPAESDSKAKAKFEADGEIHEYGGLQGMLGGGKKGHPFHGNQHVKVTPGAVFFNKDAKGNPQIVDANGNVLVTPSVIGSPGVKHGNATLRWTYAGQNYQGSIRQDGSITYHRMPSGMGMGDWPHAKAKTHDLDTGDAVKKCGAKCKDGSTCELDTGHDGDHKSATYSVEEFIAKRKDANPDEGKDKYGSGAHFADPKNKKYPLDTEAHIRAALSYWGMPKNRSKYSSADQKTIGGRINAAAKKHGIGNHELWNAEIAYLSELCSNLEADMKTYADKSQDPVGENSNAIRGVEIFGAGKHNGDEYTEQDIDDMVAAFKNLDFQPAIKVGHTKDEPGAPAYGWVTNLRRVGQKLVADFESMHDSVIDAIRKKSYDRVSSEIYFNLERGGKQFRRALKAVALLGADVPAVANLTPLHKMQFSIDKGFEAVRSCDVTLEVPTTAMLTTLAERVSGLTQLIKESEMATNAETLTELKTKHSALAAQIKELKNKVAAGRDAMDLGGDNDSDDLGEEDVGEGQTAGNKKNAKGKHGTTAKRDLEAAETELRELAEQIEALETAENPELVALKKQLADEKKARELAEKKADETATRVAKLEQSERLAQVGEKIKACKVPAFRTLLEPLYHYALVHSDVKVKVYSVEKDGDKEKTVSKELSISDVTDGIVKEINAQSEKLFKALAYAGNADQYDQRKEGSDPVTGGDPSKELAAKVEEHKAKHPEIKKYEEHVAAVLKADPELSKRYRAQFAGTAQ